MRTENILKKAADGLMEEGRPFTGVLYAGLMQTESGPKVIEFNTRFGDPETQVVLPLWKTISSKSFWSKVDGKDPQLKWKDEACVGVVVASKGYPREYEKGKLTARRTERKYVHHRSGDETDRCGPRLKRRSCPLGRGHRQNVARSP